MNRLLRHIVLLFAALLMQLCGDGVLYAAKGKVVYDTASAVQLREPDKEMQRDIYTSSDYVYDRRVKDTEDNWFQRFLKWLAEQFRFNPTPMDAPKGASALGQVAVVILAVGLLVLLVFLLTKTNVRSIFLKKKQKETDDDISGKTFDVDIHGIDFKERIAEAVRIGDYRVAVRLHFLAVLKQLSEKEKINWRIDKTNHDYYLELAGSPLQQPFFETAFLYEYIWYGDFKIGLGEYQLSEDQFKQINTRIDKG